MNQSRLLTAMFDNRSEAERAIERLVQAGFPRQEITLHEGNASASSASRTSATATSGDTSTSPSYESSGFWASLSQLFMPDEDRYTYAEGLRRGGYVVSLYASDAKYDRALDILDDEGTVNVDERAERWRSEGWSRPTTTATTAGTGYTGTSASAAGMSSAGRPTSMQGTSATGTTARNADQVIPVVEERLRVGKRETGHGRVRVRSYVTETPVQEQVNLRQEHVQVERRPVDRPLQGSENAFKDRTIEATERSEEAVVSKEARVVEEVSLRKDAKTQRETVSDTVRKTKVEVENERSQRGTGTTDPAGRTKRPL